MLMPHRSYASTANYRFGFNGKENDNEAKGLGNEQDYGMRIYDPRIGKFLSTDPLFKSYPELSYYQFASNSPISGVDQDGLEWELSTTNNNLKNKSTTLVPSSKIVTTPSKNQAAGLNLGFLKLSKQSYDNTTWWIPTTKSSGFINNSVTSAWNQNVSGLEFTSQMLTKKGRNQFKASLLNTLVKASYWMEETSLVDKFDYVYTNAAEKASDVNTYEDFSGAILLGAATEGILGPGSSTLSKSVYYTRLERLQIFYRKLEESVGASTADDAIKLINKTLDGVEDIYSGVKKQSGIPKQGDGRMYGILDEKYITRHKDGSITAITKGNRIEIAKDGSFVIKDRDGVEVFYQKQAKGKGK